MLAIYVSFLLLASGFYFLFLAIATEPLIAYVSP